MPAFIQARGLARALEPCHSQHVLKGLSRVSRHSDRREKRALYFNRFYSVRTSTVFPSKALNTRREKADTY